MSVIDRRVERIEGLITMMEEDMIIRSVKPQQVADLLEKAADLMETVGHCKGRFVQYKDNRKAKEGEEVAYCPVAAISHARIELGHSDHIKLAARHALVKHLGLKVGWSEHLPYDFIARWNDEPERTTAEVIDAFKETAKDLRNQ